MVRETKLQARVEGVTAEAFYEIVYADPAPIKRYHAASNACHHAVATPWLDGRRTVHFTLQVALPAAFQKIVGAGPVPVREVQTVSWDSGCSFAVTSEPEMSFPGAASFPTTVTVAVRQAPGPALAVDLTALVRCSAGVPWVMQKTVEGLMVDQAQASLSGFLEFCQTICCEHLSAPPPLPKLTAAPAPDRCLEAASAAAVATPPAVPPPATPPVPVPASDASGSERSASAGGGAAGSSSPADSEDDSEEDVFHDIPSSASSDVSASDSEASSGAALDEATHRVAEAAARLRQWPPAAAAAAEGGEGSSEDERQQHSKARALPEARPPPGGYVQRYVAAAAASGGSSPALQPAAVRPARRQARHSEAAGAVAAGAAADMAGAAAADASALTAAGAEALAARVAELVQVQDSTHRLLRDMEARLASVELDLLRAKAYQEGAAAALRAVGGARLATTALALVATAAAASSVTALLLMRRRG